MLNFYFYFYFSGRKKFCDGKLIKIFSGGRPEGSKHNLKFQSAMWHHFKHFQSKDFIFSCCLSFTALELFCHYYMKNPQLHPAIKILIPFIILGARPTSTPGPKRDQLVLKYVFLFFSKWNLQN